MEVGVQKANTLVRKSVKHLVLPALDANETRVRVRVGLREEEGGG